MISSLPGIDLGCTANRAGNRIGDQSRLVAYLGKESAAALGLVVPAKAKRPAKAKAKAGRES